MTGQKGDWVLRLHFERLDEHGRSLGRDKVFLGWDASRDALEARARPFAHRLERVAGSEPT
jgi:hypothetical protein